MIGDTFAKTSVAVLYDGSYSVNDKNHFITKVIEWFNFSLGARVLISDPAKYPPEFDADIIIAVFEDDISVSKYTLMRIISRLARNKPAKKLLITRHKSEIAADLTSKMLYAQAMDLDSLPHKNAALPQLSADDIALAIICLALDC